MNTLAPLRSIVCGGIFLLAAAAAPAAESKPAAQPAVATNTPALKPIDEQSLFDGWTLTDWAITDFAGHGKVSVKRVWVSRRPNLANPKGPDLTETNGPVILLEMGAALTGIIYTNPLPRLNYEVSLDAQRVDGTDFFCGLTFPVRNEFCTLIIGGWGGGVVGLSSLDGFDASENETTKFMAFESGRWYHVRLRVTAERIEAWLDAERVINVAIASRKISLRPGEIELSKPFGIASWQTTAALRNLELRQWR